MASISPNNFCICLKKPAETLTSCMHRWQLVYNLQQAILYHIFEYLDQRSLFGTISFIKEFHFDIK